MAVPKKKTSVSRKGLRRAGQHHKLYAANPMKCPNCNANTLKHKACPSCGQYRGRVVLAIETTAEESGEVKA